LFTSFRTDPNGDLALISAKEGKEENPVYPLTSGPSIDGQGKWSGAGNKIAYRRIEIDTNGDGRVTVEDNSTVWQKTIDTKEGINPSRIPIERGEMQITPGSGWAQDPCFDQLGSIYYSAEKDKGWDIWSIPENGVFQRLGSAEAQYNTVWDRFGEASADESLEHSILGYQRVLDYFPNDSLWCARALGRMGETCEILGKRKQAKQKYEILTAQYLTQKKEAAVAFLKLAGFPEDPITVRDERCRRVLGMFPDDPSMQAEAWILLGDLNKESRNTVESLTSFGRVLKLPQELRNWKAQAQLKIADLIFSQGQTETARQSLLAVLREYGDIPLWRERAGKRLLDQIQGEPQARIAQYQQIIQQFLNYPSLVAEAQLAIADVLKTQKQYDRAFSELEQMEGMVPGLLWAHAKSKIMQAGVRSLSGDDLKGIFLLESVIQRFQSIEGGRFAAEAKDSLFALLFRSAERLKMTGDCNLAAVRYKKALELKPFDIPCHRGWVECLSRIGKIEEAILEYDRKLAEAQRNPVLLYGMGLALSYQGEKNPNVLKKSNEYLAFSLEENYRMIPPYRTMGFNYEAMEKLSEKQKTERHGFVCRAVGTIASPLKWAVGLLPFRKKADQTGYYEKAIQALSTALELNDEKSDPRLEARIAQNLANNFYNLGEYGFAKAFQYYRLRLLYDTTYSNLLEKATLFERAGHCALFIEELEPASAYLKQAIQIYSDLGREEESLLSMRRLAMLNYQAGKYNEAVQVFEALATRDEKANRQNELELDYRNMAFNYHLMGEDEDALNYALKAEYILKAQHIPETPPKKSYLRIEVFGFSIPVWGMEEIGGALAEGFTLADEAAMTYGLISRSEETLKRYDRAVAYEEKRLSMFRNRKDRFAERISLNRLGLLYYKSADYDKAWEYFVLSLEASKKKKVNDAVGMFVNAVNLGNVAMVELALHGNETHWTDAVQYLTEQLVKWNQQKDLKRRERMTLSNALGVLWLLRAKPVHPSADLTAGLLESIHRFRGLGRAESYFRESLKLAQEEGKPREEAVVLKNLAEVFEQAGDIPGAVRFMKQSLDILEKIQDQEWIWRVRSGLANLESRLSDEEKRNQGIVSKPLERFEQAMDELESLPVQEAGSEELLSDRNERQDLYVHAAFQAAEEGMAQKALEIAERGKEKEISDLLARRPPDLKRERHKNQWKYLQFYRTSLLDLRKQLLEQPQGKKRSVLQDSVGRMNKEYQELLVNIQDEDPVLAFLAGALPVEIDALRKRIPETAGVLCYLCDENGTLLWFADRDTVVAVPILPGRTAMREFANTLWESIQKDSAAENQCRELYRVLVQPAESRILGKRSLIIVPDRTFWDVPFEALSAAGTVLSEKFEISYAPSLTAYWLAWNRRRINLQKGLLVGDARDDVLVRPLTQICPESASLLGPKATEQAFREQVKEADLVQTEKWIVPNPGDPLNSALVLSPDSTEDGFLKASEVFKWELKANLMMLPPAIGRAWNPEPFLYALHYAGVPSVMVPLWQTDRETKRLLLETFYRTAEKSSFTRALQQACRTLKDRGQGIKSWAGFRLIGFGGMDSDARLRFAGDNLTETVLQARAYEQKEEFEDAVVSYEKALSMSEVLRDTLSTVNIWREIVRLGMKGKLWNKAVAYQMKLIQQAERTKDSTAVLTGYRNLSAFCVQNNWLEAAVQAKSKAIEMLEKRSRNNLAAAQYEELAFIHEREQKYQQAVAASQKAYDLYQGLNNRLGMAKALIRKGRFLLEAEQIWTAKEALRSGSAVLDSLQQNENDVYELASGYTLLGLVCDKLTQYDEAFQYQEKAQSLFTKLNRGTQVAQTNQYLANLYWKTGNYRMALTLQKKALDTFIVLQDAKLLVMAYGTLGLIYSSLGDLTKAEDAEQKALDLAEKANNRTDKAAILKNLGIIRIQQNQMVQATELLKKATAIDSSLGLASGLASDYRNLGNLLNRLNRPKESIPVFQKSVAFSNRIGDRRNAIQCFFGLGQAFFDTGDKKAAMAALDSGLVMAESLALPDLAWRLYRQRAKLLTQSGQTESAFQDYQKAVDIVEKQRSELKVAAFQQGFLDDKMDLYSDAVRLLVDMNQPDRAFDFVERAKSRNFIDLLGNQKPAMKKGRDALLASEQASRNAVQEAQDRLVDLLRKKSEWTQKDQDEKQHWESELNQRRKSYGDLLASIQSESPELASFVSVDPYKVSQIQSLLPDSTALIEYYLSTDELFFWVSTSNRLADHRVRVAYSQIEETVRKFRDAIQSHLSIDKESQALYTWLIEPCTKELQNVKHLVFVPHGILHYLPFSALKDKEGKFLIERVSISLVPSATVLGYCLNKSKNRASSRPGNMNVLAVANPDLGDPRYNLSFAEKEVQSLKRTFGTVTSFSEASATEEAVRRSTENSYRLIHFACHGEYEPETPLFSALLLAQDPKHDGRLEAQEIFGLNFDCDLVTLSACETGLATVTRGDEIIGLARSFIFSGAPSVITSLWKVDDLATAVLMKRFYRNLKQGLSKAEALRRAQLLVKESLNGHPSAWAAFHITGDFR